MQFHRREDESLDPRRTRRGGFRRDWASMSGTIGRINLPELLARALVRLGVAR